jgi:hypothetical protein
MKLTVLMIAAGTLAFAQVPEGRFERTLKVSGPVSLDLITDSGGISVKPGPAGAVQIRGILKGHRGWNSGDAERRIRALEQNPPIEQSGDSIRAGHVSSPDLLRGISMRLEILAPPDSSLLARADSGGIQAEGIKGPVDARADSGGIGAVDIGSEVRATADSGGIHIRNVRGPVFARTDSGGIEALDIGGSIDASADSGGLRVSQTAPAPVRIRVDSGGATVKLAPAGGYDIRVNSDTGRITVPEMTVRGTVSPHRAEGKVRGGGPLVDVQVDSGNIRIE